MPPGGQGLDRSKPEVQRLLGEQERMIRSYGQILGEEVKYVIMMMRRFETDVTLKCLHKTVSCPARRQLNGGGRAGYEGQYEDAGEATIDLHLTMLDDIPVVGTSGEPYNPIAVELKQKSPYARTMLTTLCQGTFTGYSALCLAEGLAEGGKLVTIEHNDELEETIRRNFARSPLGERIELRIGDAKEVISNLMPSKESSFRTCFREKLCFNSRLTPGSGGKPLPERR